MNRVVEPELMSAEDQAQAYAHANFEAAHSLYPKLFAEKFPKRPRAALALDLGCGPCDVTIRFAKANPGYKFHAVDGSAAMLKFGQATVAAQRLSSRVKLIKGFIPGAPIPQAAYDVILSSSFLHHLHDPQVLWQTVRQYVKQGTIVFITDLRRPVSRLKARAIVRKTSASEPLILRRDFYNSLLAAFTPAEVRAQLRAAGLESLRVQVRGGWHMLVFGKIE